jgi:hypothetical protein
MRRPTILFVLLLFGGGVVASAGAGTPVRDIPQSYLFTAGGGLALMKAGTTYGASLFPIPIRVTPAGGWSGAQWKSGRTYFRGGAPPNYGWVHIGRGTGRPAGTGVPRGLISIMTAYAHTPSVAATVNVLRTRGHGASYEAIVPVTVAGFSGSQFDGTIVGTKNFDHVGHYFIPFSPKSTAAKYYPDEYGVYSEAFRVIVIDVRQKTVVIYIEDPADSTSLPAFLKQADSILGSLRFPTK